MRERLLLIPTEHWREGIFEGVRVDVSRFNEEKLAGWVGCFCIKPMKLREAIEIVMASLEQSGHSTKATLYGKTITFGGKR